LTSPHDPSAVAASDPQTPAAELARLAYERVDLRASIAANPATYPELLTWLGELGDPAVDQALQVRAAGSGRFSAPDPGYQGQQQPGEGSAAPFGAAPQPTQVTRGSGGGTNRGLLVGLIVAVAVLALGGGGWALYELVFSGDDAPTTQAGGEGDAGGQGATDQAELRQQCTDGDMEACDDLYWETPLGSDDEQFGSTCGETREQTMGGCVEAEGGSTDLGELRELCTDGDMEACDDLYWETPVGSDDEQFGSTCGETREPTYGGCVDAEQDSTAGAEAAIAPR